MSYSDIFILGWNLNALMFVVNLILAFRMLRAEDMDTVRKESEVLNELKNEFDKFYPNRKSETIISYLIPFTAFYRVSWRFAEMVMFFNKNQGTKMFDFMVYKYQADINKIKQHPKEK